MSLSTYLNPNAFKDTSIEGKKIKDMVQSITWNDLKTKRDRGLLTPGMQYRITDYIVVSDSTDFISSGEQFDIIVRANGTNVLDEVASAIQHTTADSDPFKNCKLNAWKIWYCLDNDSDRFIWASTNGKGVIYRMIDEFNNDIPYDFKTIKFKHPKDTSTYPYYYYTFAHANVENNADTSLNIRGDINVYNNTMGAYIQSNIQRLNKNVFIGYICHGNTFGNNCYSNTFETECNNNTFGNECSGNTFGSNCGDNTFGYHCGDNTFGYLCTDNNFGSMCGENTFGNYCYSNTFGYDNSSNTFGDVCYSNTFGNNCGYIKFADSSSATTKYMYYRNNHFGDGCNHIVFKGAETASDSMQVQNYRFAQGTSGTSETYLIVEGKRGLNYETFIGKDKSGEKKETVIVEKIDKMIDIHWANLKLLRDNSKLIPGQKYRITDYTTSTIAADTQSANHPFDVIVTALDINKLSEVASAIQSARDTEGYFSNSDLSSWELKYCLDNDTSRFDWISDGVVYANDGPSGDIFSPDKYDYNSGNLFHYKGTFTYNGQTYYQWSSEQFQDLSVLTTERDYTNNNLKTKNNIFSITPKIVAYLKNDATYEKYDANLIYIVDGGSDYIYTDHFHISIPQSTGVIYYMKDEYGNECPYDFKNIQFKRYKVTGVSGDDGNLKTSLTSTFKNSYISLGKSNYTLGNSGLSFIVDGTDFKFLYTFSVYKNNVFLDDSFIPYCRKNKMGTYYRDESDAQCLNNNVFCDSDGQDTDSFLGNTFKENCYNNTCWGYFFNSNTFGVGCYNNIFGNEFRHNTFGNNIYDNTFGSYFYYNTFGNNCYRNTFGNNCGYNTFGNTFSYNTLGAWCQKNSFMNFCTYNSFGGHIEESQFGDCVQYFALTSTGITSAPSSTNLKSYARWLIVENGIKYVNVCVTNTTSNNSYFQNIRICQGCSGTSSTARKSVVVNSTGASRQLIVCYDTSGTLRTGNLGNLLAKL